jgi:hypothetical protein
MAHRRQTTTVAGQGRSWAVLLLDDPDDLAGRPDLAVAAADHVGDQAGPPGLVPGATRSRSASIAAPSLASPQYPLGRLDSLLRDRPSWNSS